MHRVWCLAVLLLVPSCIAFAQYGFLFECRDDTVQSGANLIEFRFNIENTGSVPDSYAIDCRIIDSVPGWFELFCAGGTCAEPGTIIYDFIPAGVTDTMIKISIWPTVGYAIEVLNLHVQSVGDPALKDSINVYAIGVNAIKEGYRESLNHPSFVLTPNPARSMLVINCIIPSPTILQLSMYNAGGHVVNEKQTMLEGGNNRLLFDVGDMSAGIYFLRLETHSHREIQKVIITR